MPDKSEKTDDKKAGLQATDGTPTGSLDDPAERPSQPGVLGGTEPHTDTRPSDDVPPGEGEGEAPKRD